MADRQRAVVLATGSALAERSLKSNPRMTRGLVRAESLLEEQHVGEVLRVHSGPCLFNMSPGKFSVDGKYFLRQVMRKSPNYSADSADDSVIGIRPCVFQLLDESGELLRGWDGFPPSRDDHPIRNYKPFWDRFCPIPGGWVILTYLMRPCDDYDPEWDNGLDIHALFFALDFTEYWDLGHISGKSSQNLACLCQYDDGAIVFFENLFYYVTQDGLEISGWSDVDSGAKRHVQFGRSIVTYEYPYIYEYGFKDSALQVMNGYTMRDGPFSLSAHGELLIARFMRRLAGGAFVNRIAAIHDGQIIGAFTPDISGLTPIDENVGLSPRDISCSDDTIVLSVANSNEGFVSYRGGGRAAWEALPALGWPPSS